MENRIQRKPSLVGYWPERIGALLAIIGLAASISFNRPISRSEGAASDFKILYGSAFSLAHGLDAFNVQNVKTVFRANGVIQPNDWYGHAPVYPPFTLALLSPLAALPMVPALYVWFAVCCLAQFAAISSLAQAAGEQFGLSRPWRLGLIAAAAAWPFCSFGLQMENVSVVASSLCVTAVVWPGGRYRWLRCLGLALALLLKPHLAVWVVVGLALLPNVETRWLAPRAAGLAICLGALLCLQPMLHGQLGMQWTSYSAMLHSELYDGSMSPRNHELLDISAQILSLESLAGFFGGSTRELTSLVAVVLTLGAAALTWASVKPTERASGRFPLVAAWCAFGMLTTYHRGHDGVVLLILLPWVFARLQSSARDGYAWLTAISLIAMSASPDKETWWRLGTSPGLHALSEFLLYRQAAFATLVLCCILLSFVLSGHLQRAAERSKAAVRRTGPAFRSDLA